MAALASLLATPARAAEGAQGYPRSGYLTTLKLAAHSAPRAGAPVVRVLDQFRADARPTVVLAVAGQEVSGVQWLQIELPGRPNGRLGWVRAALLDGLVTRKRQIVIDRGQRTLRVVSGGQTVFTTTIAVGRPGMETPTGHFYVTASFHPASSESFLGPWAFETSAYSKLSDWPGGGIVGIHGWNDPSVFGHAVSHGCVRVPDAAILRLRSLVSVGTPISIVD